MYKCVIFDLDGTLLNTLEDLANVGNRVLEKMGFPQHETEKYKYFVGNGIPKLIERIIPEGCSDEDRKKVHELYSENYGKHCCDNTKPYEGIAELLRNLKNNGIMTAVATNKDHSFSVELVKEFFDSSIDIVVGRKDGFPKKPDPYAVNYILNELGIDKSDTLYVGDSDVDMQTALNAGVCSCGALWGYRTERELTESGACHIAASAEELYHIAVGK